MRLIDADKIVKDDHQHYEYMSDTFYVTVADIEAAPTIDAVPVVRCRDCKWGKKTSKEGIFYHCGYPYEQTGKVHLPNWYCPGGTRKEDKA